MDSKATTALLRGVREGGRLSNRHLLPHVYDELRRLAQARLSAEPGSVTVSATGLVHEAYLKLIEKGEWEDRAHFLAVASRAMRQILTDRARARQALKRGGRDRAITLADSLGVADDSLPEQILAVNQALDRLADFEPDLARFVEMRFFGGMTVAEVAEATGVTRRTATRQWARAKAYLHVLLV